MLHVSFVTMHFADTPTSLSKLSRGSKESTPIANDDVKRIVDAPAVDRKTLVKESSQESDSSLETEKRPSSVVSICNLNSQDRRRQTTNPCMPCEDAQHFHLNLTCRTLTC